MNTEPYSTTISTDMATSLVSAARTSLGDTLRSVVYFTPSAFDLLYLRQDLYDSTDAARTVKEQLVELERVGFAEAPVRTTITHQDDGAGIGPYEFTIRFHEDGFVIRVLEGDVGTILTTDSMDLNAFEDAATAVRRLLADESSDGE
ncbi:DUF7522 family protein [Natrialba swarupiae]|uniref:Uncharacterized protein n=1 Tax=Natrialba swarupiae TaxID=2448032 RepID=A0A5D5AHS8_9EURY|nr:hypothetical protein [Natrialba swarupiae]MCW8173363.1 hypothetical protein [Natrialba swarupiae]TYT61286.1 hypothetical protein FYC77_14630 [Natrialba swarupiae]